LMNCIAIFQRNIRSGCDQSVEMVRHDDERLQEEFSLTVIVEEGSLQQFRRGSDLKKASALRRHRGDQIRPSFLGREPHLSSIYERPVAKAILIASLNSGPEGPCSLRQKVVGVERPVSPVV